MEELAVIRLTLEEVNISDWRRRISPHGTQSCRGRTAFDYGACLPARQPLSAIARLATSIALGCTGGNVSPAPNWTTPPEGTGP